MEPNVSDKTSVNLRTVADHVGLAPCTISAILNNTTAAQTIPKATKDRVFRAAAELNYRPNVWARSLRTKRTRMVAIVAPDFGDSAVARVIAGAQSRLHRRGYMLSLGTLEYGEPSQFTLSFEQRGVEGLIVIDSMMPGKMGLPVASVELDVVSSDAMTHETSSWLSALGEAAAP